MAILSILIAMIGTVFSAASQSVSTGISHLDADSEARLVFDRMADDINNMIVRSDVDYIFDKIDNDNDNMFFFSHAPGYADNTADVQGSNVSLVGYRINSNLQLERLGKQLDWTGTGDPGSLPFLTYGVNANGTFATQPTGGTIAGNWPDTVGSAQTSPPYTGTDNDYHVLGEGVFRMELTFLESVATTQAGNTTTTLKYADPPPPVPGTYPLYAQTATANGVITTTTVKGIVVTIAVLDKGSRRIVTDPTTEALTVSPTKVVSSLSDATANDPPLTAWKLALQSATYPGDSGLPPAVASHVRVYQRIFYLNSSPAAISP